MAKTPFTFGIALTPRASTRDWTLVQALLDLTLSSLQAQTDGDFTVLIAGHDRPRLNEDDRIRFLGVDWPVQPPGPHNDDSGRKKHWLNDLALRRGGGLFMLLDADDWIDVRLVEVARAVIGEDDVGGLITAGAAVDLQTLAACPLPLAGVFEGQFHRLCGSSTVARLQPHHPDPVRRDPFTTLRSHHQWLEVAQDHGLNLAMLPVGAAYLVNTSENHSDLHGPHALWRAEFIDAVNRRGRALDDTVAAGFGQAIEKVRAVSASVHRATA